MKEFCRKFFTQQDHDVAHCQQCADAWEEVQEHDRILAQATSPIYYKSELEKSALDCHSQP